MQPETIEIKNSKDALNAMKYAIPFFFLGIIIVIFLAGKVSTSILGILAGTVVVFPLVVIIACISVLRNVPSKIELHPDRAHFIYWQNISNKPPNIYWIDVVDFQIFGKLQDRFGNTINLVYLSKEQYHKIQQYLEQAVRGMDETLRDYPSHRGVPVSSNISRLPPGAQPQQILLPTAPATHTETKVERPADTITISKRPVFTIIIFSIIAGVSSFLTFAFATGSAYSEPVDFPIGIILVSLGLIMIVISIIIVYRAFKKKELIINELGIQLKVKGRIEFQYSWNELDAISLIGRGYPFSISLIFKTYDKTDSVTSEEFVIDDLKRAFEIIRKYAACYGTPIKNDLGW